MRVSATPSPSASRSSVMRFALGTPAPALAITCFMTQPLMPLPSSFGGAFVSATSTSPLGRTWSQRGWARPVAKAVTVRPRGGGPRAGGPADGGGDVDRRQRRLDRRRQGRARADARTFGKARHLAAGGQRGDGQDQERSSGNGGHGVCRQRRRALEGKSRARVGADHPRDAGAPAAPASTESGHDRHAAAARRRPPARSCRATAAPRCRRSRAGAVSTGPARPARRGSRRARGGSCRGSPGSSAGPPPSPPTPARAAPGRPRREPAAGSRIPPSPMRRRRAERRRASRRARARRAAGRRATARASSRRTPLPPAPSPPAAAASRRRAGRCRSASRRGRARRRSTRARSRRRRAGSPSPTTSATPDRARRSGSRRSRRPAPCAAPLLRSVCHSQASVATMPATPNANAVATHWTVRSRKKPAVPTAATTGSQLSPGRTIRWRKRAPTALVTIVSRKPVAVPGSQCLPCSTSSARPGCCHNGSRDVDLGNAARRVVVRGYPLERRRAPRVAVRLRRLAQGADDVEQQQRDADCRASPRRATTPRSATPSRARRRRCTRVAACRASRRRASERRRRGSRRRRARPPSGRAARSGDGRRAAAASSRSPRTAA